MINSALNEGLRGMQGSQREMQKSAQEIARVNVREPQEVAPVDKEEENSALRPLNASKESAGTNLSESLVELRRQEQLFDASAKIVSVANETLGSLLDVST